MVQLEKEEDHLVHDESMLDDDDTDEDYVESEDDDSEEELQAEPSKKAVYNKEGLLEKLEDIAWPENVDWMHKLTVDHDQGEKVDVNDDLTRELACSLSTPRLWMARGGPLRSCSLGRSGSSGRQITTPRWSRPTLTCTRSKGSSCLRRRRLRRLRRGRRRGSRRRDPRRCRRRSSRRGPRRRRRALSQSRSGGSRGSRGDFPRERRTGQTSTLKLKKVSSNTRSRGLAFLLVIGLVVLLSVVSKGKTIGQRIPSLGMAVAKG